MIRTALVLVLSASLLLVPACAQDGTAPPPADTARDISLEDTLARGGRLYDKWYKEAGAEAPTTTHPAYPADGAYAEKPGTNWRCKECHGWDYAGHRGAYSSGKHATGISGVLGKSGASPDEVLAVLRSESHGYGNRLGEDDLRALALFVTQGTLDMDALINRETKQTRGDAGRGKVFYATLCAGCHGDDGKAPDMPALGDVARKNPWEYVHKVQNGQPGTEMPALRALDLSITVDILAFSQTLPGE